MYGKYVSKEHDVNLIDVKPVFLEFPTKKCFKLEPDALVFRMLVFAMSYIILP